MTDHDIHKYPRIHIDRGMQTGDMIALSDNQHHYLRNVMRLEAGDHIRLFNGADGDYLGEIADIGKKETRLRIGAQIRPQSATPDIRILASPVKKEAFDLMVEKASELGAASFQPVICARTVVHRVNLDRMTSIAIEAAEQCERQDIMVLNELMPLADALTREENGRSLVFCLERDDGIRPIAAALKGIKTPLSILIGPEGGFTPEEICMLKARANILPVSLGPRILRAETALISALSAVQAISGDWA